LKVHTHSSEPSSYQVSYSLETFYNDTLLKWPAGSLFREESVESSHGSSSLKKLPSSLCNQQLNIIYCPSHFMKWCVILCVCVCVLHSHRSNLCVNLQWLPIGSIKYEYNIVTLTEELASIYIRTVISFTREVWSIPVSNWIWMWMDKTNKKVWGDGEEWSKWKGIMQRCSYYLLTEQRRTDIDLRRKIK